MEPVSLSVCVPAVADLHSKIMDAPPDPNAFNVMQSLGKFGKILMLAPPGGLVPPPGNSGSATGLCQILAEGRIE